MGELAAAAADATLVYLSCHGDYHWADPLSSVLLFGTRLGGRPGFDLKIADLFDAIRIGPDAVVILGACDSGTVAQTDLNEGIGIPGGLLAGGEHGHRRRVAGGASRRGRRLPQAHRLPAGRLGVAGSAPRCRLLAARCHGRGPAR